jgi:hypothetical protein
MQPMSLHKLLILGEKFLKMFDCGILITAWGLLSKTIP